MFSKISRLKFVVPLACVMVATVFSGIGFAEKLEMQEEKIEVARKEALNQSYIYEVKVDTHITGDLNGQPVRRLKEKEKVHAIYLEDDYGVFRTEDGIKGYVDITKLEKIEDKAKSTGVSRVNRTLEQDGEVHKLVRGESVGIVDIKGDTCIIVDEKGNEYKVASKDIDTGQKATRGYSPIRSGSSRDKLVAEAHKQLGRPYVSGDTGNRGFDCSGLTYYLYSSQVGKTLPRSSRDQARVGKTVSRSELQPGDLLFFRTSGSGVGHAAIYIGNDNMIHASTSQRRMVITNIYSSYFNSRFVTAKNMLD